MPLSAVPHTSSASRRRSKAVGIGFHKTGTKTLGECLRTLGYRTRSLDREAFALWQLGEVEAVLEMMETADGFDDWPWPLLFREASVHYPDARFILTTRRDESTWLDSLVTHVDRHAATSFNYRKYIYGVDTPREHPARFIEVYRAHNAAVRDFFEGQPGRLLEVCWEDAPRWAPLCEFLNEPMPDVPFPHLNRRQRSA